MPSAKAVDKGSCGHAAAGRTESRHSRVVTTAATPLASDEQRDVVRLAREQEGVVSRAQLRAVGFTRFQLRNRIEAHRWQRIGPRVAVLHTGPLTRRQRWWVGVLHGGPRSVLTALTALEAEGLQGFET